MSLEEIEERIDYKELEFDVHDEMMRWGRVRRVVVPRPPIFGDPYSISGFGKVFVLFDNPSEATAAKQIAVKRMFNGRTLDCLYFPEEKLAKS